MSALSPLPYPPHLLSLIQKIEFYPQQLPTFLVLSPNPAAPQSLHSYPQPNNSVA